MLRKIFTFEGRLGRKGFFYSFLAVTVSALLLPYLVIVNTLPEDISGIMYLSIKSGMSFFHLAILTPFIVRRLHDFGVSGWFSIVFWIGTLFGIRNVILLNELWGLDIDIFSAPVIIIEVTLLLLILALFLVPSKESNTVKLN